MDYSETLSVLLGLHDTTSKIEIKGEKKVKRGGGTLVG